LSRVENTAFVRGDGSQKPRGFLSLPDWSSPGVYQRNALERRDSGVNGAFTADAIIALQNDLKEAYQSRAVFGVKRAAFTSILTLKDDQGQYLINSMILREGADKVLLGKPVIFMDDLDGLSTDGQSMVYGDFNVGYTIVDRLGFRVIRDNVTKKGFVKFYTTKRTGGDVTNYESLKIMRLSA
jgi:HK97 family phage major capsid protein